MFAGHAPDYACVCTHTREISALSFFFLANQQAFPEHPPRENFDRRLGQAVAVGARRGPTAGDRGVAKRLLQGLQDGIGPRDLCGGVPVRALEKRHPVLNMASMV